MGIDDVYDEFKELGIFNDDIKEGIEKFKEGIYKGIDELEDDLFNFKLNVVLVS